MLINGNRNSRKELKKVSDQSCRHIRTHIVVWREHETWRRLAFSLHFISFAGQQTCREKVLCFPQDILPGMSGIDNTNAMGNNVWSPGSSGFIQLHKPSRSHSPLGPCIKITHIYSESLLDIFVVSWASFLEEIIFSS